MIAYDLRGHGRSPWSGPQTPAQHVADLDHVLDASGVDQVTIIGHGLGARFAVEHACEYGERATALVLLDPLLLTPPTTLLLMAERERGRGGFATVGDAIAAERSDSGLMHTPNALWRRRWPSIWWPARTACYRYRYSRDAAASASQAAAVSPDLRAVVCPTLIIHGEESELVSEDEVDQAVGRAAPGPAGDRTRWARRPVGRAGRIQCAGARVRADGDACVSLRLRAMTGPEFDAWRAAAVTAYADDVAHSYRLTPEQAAGQVQRRASTPCCPKGGRRRITSVCMIEDDGGAAVGTCGSPPNASRGAIGLYVYDVEIIESERGRGFGREAMLLVESRGPRPGPRPDRAERVAVKPRRPRALPLARLRRNLARHGQARCD